MGTPAGKQVYLVEDDHALRFWLGIELGGRGFEVSSFDSGSRFLAVLHSLAPGCVVTDLRMSDGDGFELLQALRHQQQRFPIIVITAFADIATAVRAMKLGAADFIEKPFSGDALADRIESMQQHLPERATSADVEAALDLARERLERLTQREREVLEGVVAGNTNKMIADWLGISVRTVELHRSHLMEKLAVRSVAQLVRMQLAIKRDETSPLRDP